ncbi:MAG TPA: acetyl-CoA C-acyltransferase [Kofleriaceae bacterium]|nr:acetyl-CoA C-acyltransferase [Kofleriaceae bacterium]
MTASDVFVLAAVRTPRGKGSKRGALAGISPLALVAGLCDALVERGVPRGAAPQEGRPRGVDDVVLGCASQVGEQGGNLARTAALLAGLGDEVPGVTINRFCASGLDAVNIAAARVRAGDASLVLAGGVESVSRVPMFSDGGPLWTDPAVGAALGSVHMGIAADIVATLEGYTRAELDAYALRTRERARAAWADGRAARSVVPVLDEGGRVVLDRDELVDWAPTAAEVAALPPAFADLGAAGQDAIALLRKPWLRDFGGVLHLHTRASSPPLADAAALVVVGDRAAAERTGLAPRARIVATATCAGDPLIMLTAGQDAILKAVMRHGLQPEDIDVYEFAEAFSALCIKLERDFGIPPERLNAGGGTIAMGHAFGATGAILLANAVDELERTGRRYAVAAVSGAAGLGVATLLERC